ncbi:hypothetical protein F5887DRAFT_1061724 [Amanita rubescens]|nr:hypothetical protein F5887DRAFT_1061724 [Amanita rubescens]
MSFLLSLLRPLAYVSLPFFLLRSIAASSPLGRYYVRAAMYVSVLMSFATCSAMNTNFVVARAFYALCKRVMNIHVEVEGEEFLSTRPAVYMMNHQSMLDVLIVGRLMPKQTSIMSKKSLQFTPLGPFMTLSGAIFIDRSKNTQAVRSLEVAGQLMKKLGTSLWMFPEGTRRNQEIPDMLPLKKGGFHLAVQAGIPIVPVVTENYWRMYHHGVFEEGRVKVRVLPPVSTTGLKDQDASDLAVRVRDLMIEALREISVKVPTGQTRGETKVEVHPSASGPQTDTPQLSEAKLPQHIPAVEEKENVESSASLTMSSSTSEYGAETEEDEGMILVGRPT